MIPLSLYIHLPWCVKKCPYCDFNAHPLKGEIAFEDYVVRLIEDLKSHSNILNKRRLTSIFIGGGTPSLFSPKILQPLFSALKQYQYLDNIEITIEANPGTQDSGYYQGYRDIGINRISIGGQSFNHDLLHKIGRIHNGDKTHQAIRQAKEAGFERINLDIMYGLPSQTTEEALQDLALFLRYKLEHLSWYQLNIEANTLFAVQKPNIPSDTIIDEIDQEGSQLLLRHGYQNYEISAWTKQQPSFHNLNYWHFGDYLGIGCGAHSKITLTPFQIERIIKNKHPKAYMKQLVQNTQIIDEKDIILEYCIGHFRTNIPLNLSTFEQRTQLCRTKIMKALNQAKQQGLVQITNDIIQLTDKGFRHHNDLCLSLVN